jgi:hypothetical protein
MAVGHRPVFGFLARYWGSEASMLDAIAEIAKLACLQLLQKV